MNSKSVSIFLTLTIFVVILGCTGSVDEMRKEARKRHVEDTKYYFPKIEIYDVESKYMDSIRDGIIPGVLFKLKNNGDKSLDEVRVAVYFKDSSGSVITEETFHPVSPEGFSNINNDPLKPGYIWQNPKGEFFAAKSVPKEWEEGNVELKITWVRFVEKED